MSAVLVPSLQVRRAITLRRRRELPIAGEIFFKVGTRVSENDAVAAAKLPGEMRIVRVAEEFGVEPDEIKDALLVREGDVVAQGDIIAERRTFFGLFRSKVVAKHAGTVELISLETGHVALRAEAVPLQLSAYLRGTVVAVEPERALTIESRVTFIQGIFGVGGERSGTIRLLPVKPDSILTLSDLEGVMPGDILVGGCRPSGAVLAAAAKKGAVGFVVGSLDDQALSEYLGYELGIALTGDEDVPLTVVMTEGFGTLPIADHTWELLKECDGKSASINGATQVRAGAIRPEIIVFNEQLSADQEHGVSGEMRIGTKVRIIRVPYFGLYGEIVELPRELETLSSGSVARVLRVKLRSGETVTVPRANIELFS